MPVRPVSHLIFSARNALDADATNIEIRLQGNGLESFTVRIDYSLKDFLSVGSHQVRDNGHGISAHNRMLVGQEHCTSKIASFEDLESCTSFGFRGKSREQHSTINHDFWLGQALHALCIVGSVTITTRAEQETLATELVFDHRGIVAKYVLVNTISFGVLNLLKRSPDCWRNGHVRFSQEHLPPLSCSPTGKTEPRSIVFESDLHALGAQEDPTLRGAQNRRSCHPICIGEAVCAFRVAVR